MKRARVMIVDDDRDLAESLAELIEVRGHQVEIASNGREAVERFRREHFDIAFMDVRMPVMNGVDSFLEIRKLRPEAKVVMMTGFKEPMVQKALEEGALGLLHKPFSIDDLLEKLAKAAETLVLVVDDDVDFAEGLSEVLTHHGYKTALAANGADAVKRVEAGDIDVLILDLRLPIMDGLEVYRTLKAKGNAPPTIIVTASLDTNREAIAALRSMAVKECFAKPVDPGQLMSTIERILDDAA